jgi:DNA-binding protein HU-beta
MAKKAAKKTKKKAKKKATKKAGTKTVKKGGKKAAKKKRRTTHRSSAGKKLYAVRNADGTFNDIQQYSKAHAADLRQSSDAEEAAEGQHG